MGEGRKERLDKGGGHTPLHICIYKSRLDPGSKKELYKSFGGQLGKLAYGLDAGL